MKRIDKTTILSLGFGCPYGEEAVGCPLAAIRKFPPDERIAMITAMSSDAMIHVYAYHCRCLSIREHTVKRQNLPRDISRIG